MINDNSSLGTPSLFQAPLTKNDLRQHVVTISLVLVRQLHFIFHRPDDSHEKAQIQLLGMTSTKSINNPDVGPFEEDGLPLTYEQVANTAFATTMEELYELAYHGMLYGRGYYMNSESSASWVSRVLVDLSVSHFAHAWDDYSSCKDAVRALVEVCETAQARMVLEHIENGDNFMGWYGYEGHEGLTFRQIALLSGMTEASLRTMANPKRSKPLKTFSHGRNTYISPADAKEWLISKGRYVPIANIDRQGAELDLVNETFHSFDDFCWRLDSRLHFLLGTEAAEDVTKALEEVREGLLRRRLIDQTPYLALEPSDYANTALMSMVGGALQLPSDLLALRSAAVYARSQAEDFERRIKEMGTKDQQST
ncbi:MAG: hypothetical protein ACK4OE_25030 [Acidovorax sp.]|uniref:hypothetical protein n=1 Tax=Acidovorax sp. TaxID=1872122 RepID=UPI00391BF155